MFAVLTFKNTDMKTQLEYYVANKRELTNIFKNIGDYSGISFKNIFGPKPSSKAYKSGLGSWYVHFEISDKEQYNQFINLIYNQY